MALKFGFTLQSLIDKGRISKNDVDALKASTKSKITDEQLALFLMSQDNDLVQARSTMANYFTIRKMMPQVFANRNINSERLQNQLRVGFFCEFPKTTLDNYSVVLVKLKDKDYRKVDFEACLKIIAMGLDTIAYFNPPDGVVAILDFEGVTARHLTILKIVLLKTFLDYVQNALPLKIKQIHLLNSNYLLTAGYNLVKQFVAKKFQDKIHFHRRTDDMGWFHTTWLAKEYLPEEYGGDLPPISVIQQQSIDKMMMLESYFEIDERQTLEYAQ